MREECAALLLVEAKPPAGGSSADAAAAQTTEDDVRQQLADGVPVIRGDASVSPQMLRFIAVVRTIILWTLCGGGLAGACACRRVVFAEEVLHNHVGLVVSLCGEMGPTITSIDPAAKGFVELVKQEERKVVSFTPVGAMAAELGLPELRYYASEEYKAGGPRWSLGYSFGLFPMSELHFVYAVRNETDCLQPRIDEKMLLLGSSAEPNEEETAATRLGLAVGDLLEGAGRRAPHAWMATAPQFHGPMMIRTDTEKVWESSSGVFGVKYHHSAGWGVYYMVTISLRIAGGLTLHMLIGTWARKEWRRAVDTWIVQYDRLWTTRSSREAHSTTNAKGITAHRIQCCSSFFVLDHAVGNAQRNTESVFLGIMSSSVHGVVLVLLSIIPNIMACFFTEWKTIVFAMTCVHLVSGMGYGMAYYFNMRYWQRRFLLYAHLGCSFVSGSHTLFYLWSSALFILTRPFVMPDEAMVYSVSIGTVLVYVIVVGHQLQKIREGFLDQLQSKHSKGKVIGFLKYLGLDVKAIICSVVGGALLVLLVALLILLAGEMYLSSGPWSTIGTIFGTTSTAFGTVFAQLRQKQDAQEESAAGIPSMILNIV